MKLPGKLSRPFRTPQLTRIRIVIALTIAVVADGLQFLLGPLGWPFADQAIDVAAMILESWTIGFHWLLLPTFAVELIPVVDDLPTWTACAAAVIALRRHEQKAAEKTPVPPEEPTIEV